MCKDTPHTVEENEKLKQRFPLGSLVSLKGDTFRSGIVKQYTVGGVSPDCPNGEVILGVNLDGHPPNRITCAWAKETTLIWQPRK